MGNRLLVPKKAGVLMGREMIQPVYSYEPSPGKGPHDRFGRDEAQNKGVEGVSGASALVTREKVTTSFILLA